MSSASDTPFLRLVTQVFTRENLPKLCLMGVTAAAITVTGILFHQSPLRILPLYVSLFVGALQSQASRYASLLGGVNSLLYMVVYWYLGLYASAGYALLFSCPVQLATFVRWSSRKNKRGSTTRFRCLTAGQRAFVAALFLACFGGLFCLLRAAGSQHQLLDNLSSLLGVFISLLTMLAYIEYTWLMLPSGLLSIALHIATMAEHPAQITYLIFSLYSLVCVIQQFFRVRRLYRTQRQNESASIGSESASIGGETS